MAKNQDSRHHAARETSPLLQTTQEASGTRLNDSIGPDRTTYLTLTTGDNDSAKQNSQPLDTAQEEAAHLESQNTNSQQQQSDEPEGLPEVRKRMKYIFPALAIFVYMTSADQTLIVSSYGRIGSELNALNLTSWIATAYFMTLTCFQPLYGKLSDIFGRKPCLLVSSLIFGFGCVLCGLAQDMPQLIAARAVAGLGGAGITVTIVVLLSDIIPLRERGTWQGYLNLIFALGAGSGAPLGGLLADSIGWRWAFLAQGPLSLLGFGVTFFALQLPKKEDEESSSWQEKFRRIDFLGAVVLIAAVFLLLLGLDRGSNLGWNNTLAIVSVSIGFALALVFIFVELKIAQEPIAPGRVIFPRSMLAPYLCNFFSSGAWFGMLFYVPLYWQAVDGVSATVAGLRLTGPLVCSVVGSLSAGFYMQKMGKFVLLTRIGYTILLTGSLLILLSTSLLISPRTSNNSTPLTILGAALVAFGSGTSITTTLIALLSHSQKSDHATTVACSYLFRSLGSTSGVALAATAANLVLRGRLETELPRLGLGGGEVEAIAEGVRHSLAFLKELGPKVRAVVVECYADGERAAFGVIVVFAVGCVFGAALMREKALS